MRIISKFIISRLSLGQIRVCNFNLGQSCNCKFSTNFNRRLLISFDGKVSSSSSSLTRFNKNYINCRHITYVERMKQLDSLKQEPLAETTAEAFQKGKYLLFNDKNVLMSKKVLEVLKEGVHIAGKDYQSYEAIWLTFKDIKELNLDKNINEDAGLGDCCILLNIDTDGTPLFALQFNSLDKDVEIELDARFGGAFLQIEVAMFLGTTQKSASFEQAQSLLKWHRHYQFCYLCAGKLRSNTVGLQKICSNCEKVHYPKPDPAIITVITDETNRKCLLVRQKKFPPGMYTAIAGFLEMGENVEDTVRREVAEEVGLHVEKMDYITSQHWPLRGTTLMLGCLAIVKPGGVVELDKNEIEDARWFSTKELAAALSLSGNDPSLRLKNKGGDMLWVPPKPTIANNLLTAWLKKYSNID